MAVVALAMAGLAAMFGLWAHASFVEHDRYGDFEHWVRSPGTLQSLELERTSISLLRSYHVVCEYTFVFAGRTYAGTRFTLDYLPSTMSANEAKAQVVSVLGLAEGVRWRAVRRYNQDGWAIDPKDLAVAVRHSTRDPTASTLSATPPMPGILYWILIAVQTLLGGAAALLSMFVGYCSLPEVDPLKDPAWCEILFRDHPKARLRAWAQSLRHFRFVRGSGGGRDEQGDCLMVVLRASSRQEVEGIFTTLGVGTCSSPRDPSESGMRGVDSAEKSSEKSAARLVESPASGSLMLNGARVFVDRKWDQLELSISDPEKPYEVTSTAVEMAQRIESLLDPLADKLVEPPRDDRHCVCPKYYPSFWVAKGADGEGGRREAKAR